MMRERNPGVVLHAEHANRKTPDRTGDAVAIEIERRPIRRADVGDDVHLHAVDDGDEVLALQVEAAHRFAPARQATVARRRDRSRRCPSAIAPTASRRARADPDRRRCRRRRGRTNRFRTSPRAARAAGSACPYRTSCGRRSGPPDVGFVTHAPRGFCVVARSAGPSRRVAPLTMPSERPDRRRRAPSAATRSLKRIAGHQQSREPVRQRIDDGHFEREPAVVDQERKDIAVAKQPLACVRRGCAGAARSGGDARGSPSASTPTPCAERRSSGT